VGLSNAHFKSLGLPSLIARVLAGLALAAVVIALSGGADLAFAGCGATAAGCVHPAPGPIVGAGLPILAIGFGAYWLVGGFRRKPD
jgi:hypothetical protein